MIEDPMIPVHKTPEYLAFLYNHSLPGHLDSDRLVSKRPAIQLWKSP